MLPDNTPPPPFSATAHQRNIYTQGLSGQKKRIPTDYHSLAQQAHKKMSTKAWAYIAGGAGNQHTVEQNQKGFDKWRIVPQMLCDVSLRDISVQLPTGKIPSPFLLSPIGVLEMAHQQADLAVARAAAQQGIPYIFSNQASVPMETCAKAMGNSPRWFQLYWGQSNALVESLVKRAETAGCTAIVVTLDTTLLGWRTKDLDLQYLPFLEGKGIAQYTSDPLFMQLLQQQLIQTKSETNTPKPKITPQTIATLLSIAKKYPNGSFWQNLRSGEPIKAVQLFTQIYSRPSLTWKDLPFLRQITKLPILLKGILHPNDAKKAADQGLNGIIVSNHGGRQVDGAISTIEALPAIVKAINKQMPILLDSGIRGGADAFKAIALGADAVCIGRPYVYALSIAGEQGVTELLHNYMADFELTMALAGCKSVQEISAEHIVQT